MNWRRLPLQVRLGGEDLLFLRRRPRCGLLDGINAVRVIAGLRAGGKGITMTLRLGAENEDQFRQCVGGPVWDGDLISKDARDRLVDNRLLVRGHGYNMITPDGVLLAIGLRMLRPGADHLVTEVS